MINSEIMLEIFGYMGTALVVLSMLMTSVVRLRVLNICGSVISLIYAFLGGAFPIVALNGSLIVINAWQLLRMRKNKVGFRRVQMCVSDASATYFLAQNHRDIASFFPSNLSRVEDTDEAHLVFCGNEIAGILIGRREGDTFHILVDYAAPRWRDLSVGAFLYAELKSDGIKVLAATESLDYLKKCGFEGEGTLYKTL